LPGCGLPSLSGSGKRRGERHPKNESPVVVVRAFLFRRPGNFPVGAAFPDLLLPEGERFVRDVSRSVGAERHPVTRSLARGLLVELRSEAPSSEALDHVDAGDLPAGGMGIGIVGKIALFPEEDRAQEIVSVPHLDRRPIFRWVVDVEVDVPEIQRPTSSPAACNTKAARASSWERRGSPRPARPNIRER